MLLAQLAVRTAMSLPPSPLLDCHLPTARPTPHTQACPPTWLCGASSGQVKALQLLA